MNGLELVASYDFGSLVAYRYSLRAYVNATFMFDSRYLPKGSTAWTQLESIRKQNVTFGLEYKAPYGLELGLTGRYLGKRYEHNWFGYYPNVRVGLSELNQKRDARAGSRRSAFASCRTRLVCFCTLRCHEAAACRSESPQYLLRILYGEGWLPYARAFDPVLCILPLLSSSSPSFIARGVEGYSAFGAPCGFGLWRNVFPSVFPPLIRGLLSHLFIFFLGATDMR